MNTKESLPHALGRKALDAMIRREYGCFATTLDGVIMIRLLPRTSDGAAEPWLQC